MTARLDDVFDEHAFAKMFGNVLVKKPADDVPDADPLVTPDLASVKDARRHLVGRFGRELTEV